MSSTSSAAAEVALVVLLVDNPATGRSPNNDELKPPFEESNLDTLVVVSSNGMEPGRERKEWMDGECCVGGVGGYVPVGSGRRLGDVSSVTAMYRFEMLTLSLASVAQFSDVAIKERVNWDKPVIMFKIIICKLGRATRVLRISQ